MVISDFPSETLQQLGRCAVLLTGSVQEAETAMTRAFCACAGRLSELRNPKAAQRIAAKRILEATKNQWNQLPSDSPLQNLPDLQKAAIALASTDLFTPAEVKDLAGGHNARPDSQDQVVKAKIWAESHPLADGWMDRLRAATVNVAKPAPLKAPVILAGAFGVLLILAVTVWTMVQKAHSFVGRDIVEEIIGENEDMSGAEFRPVQMKAGEMADWFYMESFEQFEVPERFSKLQVIGARVFRHREKPVAEMMVDLGDEGRVLFYVIKRDAMGIQPEPKNRWQYVTAGTFTGAVLGDEERCYLVCVRGSEEDATKAVAALEKR